MRRFLIAFALLISATAHAQAPKSFAPGVLAFEKRDWAAAEKLMRDAIAGNPKESEGTVQISGQWFETYVPHYFLARALAKQKKCAEAIKEFEESERQGVTPAIYDFAKHLKTRGGCMPDEEDKPKKKVVGEVTVPFGEQEVVPEPKKPTPPVVTKPAPISPPALTPARDEVTRKRLATAIQAYLGGEYERAARLLSGPPFRDPAAAAEAALFRAASRDALYRIGGEQDAALRAQVESDLRLYRALRPTGRPDSRIFPPRFIALVR